MWRVSDERVQLDLDGPSVEVEPLRSWMISAELAVLAQKVQDAAEGAPLYVALLELFERFIYEAQPVWDIADHHGPVPYTAHGMARIFPLSVQIVEQWRETIDAKPEREALPPDLRLVESDAPTAVDALIPPGALNREIKKRLRAAKAA